MPRMTRARAVSIALSLIYRQLQLTDDMLKRAREDVGALERAQADYQSAARILAKMVR